MKILPLLFLLLLPSLHAQNPVASGKSVDELLPSQREFLNLPEEQRIAFAKNFGEATRFFQEKRIFECLDAIEKAQKSFAKSSELLNLRGCCYMEIRAFDKALADFTAASELSPKNNTIRSNMAEVLFVTKEWKKSQDLLQIIIKDLSERNVSLSRLMEFKIMLCKKKLGENEEFQVMAQKYDYQDDSPYYYYAQAALAYDQEKPVEAEEWLARANRIFRSQAIIAPWQDCLVEYGYIKSFFGEENPTGK